MNFSDRVRGNDNSDPFYLSNNEQTVDKIFQKLKVLALKGSEKVSIENPESQIITFNFGNESAKIIGRLHNANVGERDNEIRYYAEYWECKRFDWWREALNNLPIYFIDTSLIHLALDAKIDQPEKIFSLAQVIKEYNLNPEKKEDRRIAAEQWVINKVIEKLNPLLKPDFAISFFEGALRLVPLTEPGKESRLKDNQAYEKAVNALIEAIKPLKEIYSKMSEKINKK